MTVDESTKPVTLRVRFEPSAGAVVQIGRVVKKALESDPNNTAPVDVKYASEKCDGVLAATVHADPFESRWISVRAGGADHKGQAL